MRKYNYIYITFFKKHYNFNTTVHRNSWITIWYSLHNSDDKGKMAKLAIWHISSFTLWVFLLFV